MKKIASLLVLFLIFIFLFSCEKKVPFAKKEKLFIEKSLDSTYYCLQDSITISFLSKASYKEAINNCKLTLLDREFTYGEYSLIGVRRGLENYFTQEEYNSKSIVIKEVEWETKDQKFFIIVWYKNNNNKWLPIEAYKYSKGTQF